MSFNVARAIERNSHWSRHLGWDEHYPQILRLFRTSPRNPKEFADAVAQWQHFHRPRLLVDGIAGPSTWGIMRRDLGLASAPYSGPMQSGTTATHIPLAVNGHTIDFYVFISVPDTAAKVAGLRRYFERMPQSHLAAVYPIFVIEHKPHRGPGGGTWTPGAVRSRFIGNERNTHVPDSEVQRLIGDRRRGLIGIPRNRWERQVGSLAFTVMHEVGHSVDYRLGLTPSPPSLDAFRGVTPACGAGNALTRYAVEAYARFIINPGSICREPPRGDDRPGCSRRVIRALRTSPAFRSLPSNWMPR